MTSQCYVWKLHNNWTKNMTYLPLLSGIQSGYEFIFLTSAPYLVYTFQLDHSLVFSQAVRQVFNSITSRQTGRLFSLNWLSHNVSWLSVQLLLSVDSTSKWKKEKYVNAVAKLGFLDLMTNLLNVLLSVDFPFSSSKEGIHLGHALGSVHV